MSLKRLLLAFANGRMRTAVAAGCATAVIAAASCVSLVRSDGRDPASPNAFGGLTAPAEGIDEEPPDAATPATEVPLSTSVTTGTPPESATPSDQEPLSDADDRDPEEEPTPTSAPQERTVTTVGEGATGAAMTIGADGLPLIAYSSGSEMRVVHCSDTRCSSQQTSTIVGDVLPGTRASIAIAGNGRAVVGLGSAENAIRIAWCKDVPCTSATIRTHTGASFERLSSLALTVGSDGFPFFAYSSFHALGEGFEDFEHVFMDCSDLACTTAERTTLRDADTRITRFAAGHKGEPIFVRYTASGFNWGQGITLHHCASSGCPGGSSVSFGSSPLTPGAMASNTASKPIIGSDGNTRVVYTVAGNAYLFTCETSSCRASDGVRTKLRAPLSIVDAAANGTGGLTIAVGDGDSLGIVSCGFKDCIGASVDLIGSETVKRMSSGVVELGSDGVPVVAYVSMTGKVRFLHCGVVTCSS